jgi:hypothetical protein
MHGRRKFPKGISDEGVFGSLTVVIMEMTADLEGLQSSISQKETEIKSSQIPDVAMADWKQEDIEPSLRRCAQVSQLGCKLVICTR